MKYLLTLLLLSVLHAWNVGLSQDVHFSQSFHGPILLNPAWTGNYFGDWRFVQNYRQQWSQIGKPLSTIGMGMDRQFYVFRHKISAGIQIVHDESGDFRLIHQKLLGSIAYHHSVGRNEFHFGVQGGYVSKRLDFTGISLPDQFDINSGLFNASLQTREANLNNREAYADCNVGIGFSRRFARFKPEIGLALYHVNQPNESFNYDINYLAVREVIHLNAYIHLNDRYALEPRIIYMSQRKSRDLVFGTLGYMQLAKNFARAEQAFTGLYLRDGVTRNWDAFVLLLGLQFKQFRTTMSYDITVSKLRLANSYQGALEFSLIFTGVSSVLSKRAIPCRRM